MPRTDYRPDLIKHNKNNPNGILYEIDELLEFIKLFNDEFFNLKEMKVGEIRSLITKFMGTSNKLLNESCGQQKRGSSMICSRPKNHLSLHRQSAAEWD